MLVHGPFPSDPLDALERRSLGSRYEIHISHRGSQPFLFPPSLPANFPTSSQEKLTSSYFIALGSGARLPHSFISCPGCAASLATAHPRATKTSQCLLVRSLTTQQTPLIRTNHLHSRTPSTPAALALRINYSPFIVRLLRVIRDTMPLPEVQ